MSEPLEARPFFTWVHLSDCHFGHGTPAHQNDQTWVLAQLVDDVVGLVRARTVPRPDAILVTGDISSTGEATEFESAASWLRSLACELGVPLGRILTVPGNHDFSRARLAEHRATFRLLDSLRRGAEIDEALADLAEREMLCRQFEAYRRLTCDLELEPDVGDATVSWRIDVEGHGGVPVRIVGMNTALLASGKDRGCLQLGNAQLTLLLPPERERFVISMGHHPLDWLSDAASATPKLEAVVQVHLSGHAHVARIGQLRGPTRMLGVQAGAVHGDQSDAPTHSYNIASAHLDPQGEAVVRLWTRQWEAAKFVGTAGDDGLAYTEERTRWKSRRQATGGILERVSRESLAVAGGRRTAYPADYSIAELADRGILLEPQLRGFPDGSSQWTLKELTRAVGRGASCLVLGPPGAGKSTLAYRAGSVLEAAGSFAVLASLPEVLAAGGSPERLVAAAAARLGLEGQPSAGAVRLVIDGLDEALLSGMPADAVADALSTLRNFSGVLVTCRHQEFFENLLARVGLEIFDHTLSMAPWSTTDFEGYLDRLEAAGEGAAVGLREAVLGSEELQRLTSRPLFARMLTYVWSQTQEAPADLLRIYDGYLRALAAAVDRRLAVFGFGGRTYECWREIMWKLFYEQGGRVEKINAELPVGILTDQGIGAQQATAVVGAIFDVIAEGPSAIAVVRHHSFYEFLVADHAALKLRELAEARDPLSDLFGRDLPREIRRHLSRLCAERPANIGEALLAELEREEGADSARRRTVANLCAYLLGRIPGVNLTVIRRVAASEPDPFVRVALYWALANQGDIAATVEFAALLKVDPSVAALNRGYLLYYWGDLRVEDPPFVDDQPALGWERTRTGTRDMMRASDYDQRECSSRRALDIVTFIDLARFHGDRLRGDELALLSARVESLADPRLTSLVSELVGLAKGRSEDGG